MKARKIAVGDLGEFWYGDYKEPFEQLDGAIFGHPIGVVLKDDSGKLLCAYCGKVFHNLGKHVHKHGLTAPEYKAEVGLLQKTSLVSERLRWQTSAHALRRKAHLSLSASRDATLGSRAALVSPYRTQKGKVGGGLNAPEKLNKSGTCYKQALSVARSLVRDGKLNSRELNRHGISQKRIETYFGDMDGLRRLLNLGTLNRRGANRPAWTQAELLGAIKHLATDLGRTPSESDLKRHGLPSRPTYIRHFGSYVRACEMAGLPPNLPIADGKDLHLSVMVAYAITPNTKDVARTLGIKSSRVSEVLYRYGFPFAPYNGRQQQERREWAAEMARRLDGVREAAA